MIDSGIERSSQVLYQQQDQTTTTNNERKVVAVNATTTPTSEVTVTTEIKKIEVVADLTPISAEAEKAIVNFNNLKATIKTLTEQKEKAEAVLREMLGNAKKGMIDGVERVIISDRSRPVIDGKLLGTAFPEAAKACTKTTHFTVLTTK